MRERWECILGVAVCLAFWIAAAIVAGLLITHWNPPFP